DYRTELVEESSKIKETEIANESNLKRAGEELKQESSKKQKMDDDKETTELKSLMEVIPDEEEVALNAIPLDVKSPSIVDWKIHKEGKKSYYQIIRADGSSKMYLVFSYMLKSFDREDLETLYKLVKAKYGSTRPVEDLDLVLFGSYMIHVEIKSLIEVTAGIKSLLEVTTAKVCVTAAKVCVTAAKLNYNCSKIKTAERVSTVRREWIKTEEMIKIDWRSRLLM
ncbi:hypothetical protein Tco_1295534, partial [Tanacetum coccineum]